MPQATAATSKAQKAPTADATGAIPVTLLSGFLGAGKTSVINHLLRCNHGRRLTVLVNDFGRLNVDSALIAQTSQETVKLANGCICCSVREDLVDAVQEVIQKDPRPERILIELSGLSDPGKVVRTVGMLEASLPVFLDGVIAVVDAERFPEPQSEDHLLARDQLAVSDIVILNKVDLVDSSTLEARRAELRGYKPSIRLLEAVGGQVPVKLLLGSSKLPSAARARAAAHTPDPRAGHGHASFCYESKEPLSLVRLRQAVTDFPTFVVRAKGVLYLRERPTRRGLLQVVGRRARLTAGPKWNNEEPFTRLAFIGPSDGFDPERLSQLMRRCHAPVPGLGILDWVRRVARSAGADRQP